MFFETWGMFRRTKLKQTYHGSHSWLQSRKDVEGSLFVVKRWVVVSVILSFSTLCCRSILCSTRWVNIQCGVLLCRRTQPRFQFVVMNRRSTGLVLGAGFIFYVLNCTSTLGFQGGCINFGDNSMQHAWESLSLKSLSSQWMSLVSDDNWSMLGWRIVRLQLN